LSLQPVQQALQSLDDDPGLPGLWFNSLLHYSLVSSAAGRYFGFAEIGAATLKMLCRKRDLSTDDTQITEIVTNLMHLPAHDDVVDALSRLKAAGLTMVTLTNSTQQGVEMQMRNAELETYFSHLFSVEQVQVYKPHTRVYHWAVESLGQTPDNCMMIAAHGWDVAGAQWAGLRAAFVGRAGQQTFPLAPDPEINAPELGAVADAILAMPPAD
jgi:2-haloacid dehalogenase